MSEMQRVVLRHMVGICLRQFITKSMSFLHDPAKASAKKIKCICSKQMNNTKG